MAKSAKSGGKRPLSKSALYTELAERTELKKSQVQEVFAALSEIVQRELSKGAGKLVIPDVARLTVSRTKAVKGGQKKINPLNGQEYITKDRPAMNKVRIRPVKSLSESLK